MMHKLFSSTPNEDFWAGIDERNIKKVELALSKITDPEVKKALLNSSFPNSDESLLSYIVFKHPDDEQTVKLIKFLIQAGTDPATRDPGEPNTNDFCNTALLNAIAMEKWQLVQCLIGEYDPKKHQDYINMTSLRFEGQNPPLILLLKKQIALPHIVKALLNKGANPNAQNHYGETALHYAAHYGDDYLIMDLLNYKADINIRNNDGLLPFDIYAQHLSIYPSYQPIVIAEEKEGMPLFVYDPADMREFRESACSHFSALNQQAEYMTSGTAYKIMFRQHPEFLRLSKSVELIFPIDTDSPSYERNPNTEMLKKLKPPTYDEQLFIKRLAETAGKNQAQNELVKSGKYFIEKENKDINQLLAIMNQHVIYDENVTQNAIELRLEVACSNTIYKLEDNIQKFPEYNTLPIGKEILRQCEVIHERHFSAMLSDLAKSSFAELNDLAEKIQHLSSTLSYRDREAMLVKQLLALKKTENIEMKLKKEIGTILKAAGVSKYDRYYIAHLPIEMPQSVMHLRKS